MSNKTEQCQKSGEGSLNIQINQNGISLSDCQAVVKKEVEYQVNALLNDNFIKLREEALACANVRANELTQMFFDKLVKLPQEIMRQVLEKLRTPEVQISILEAQKGYIKSGKSEKLKLLSSLLKDRVTSNSETLKGILIDEAISLVPKLNQTHIDFLTCILFIDIQCQVKNLLSFKTSVLDIIVLLFGKINISDNDISFLSQLKCLEKIQLNSRLDLYKILKNRYQGLFSVGFEEKDVNMEILNRIKPAVLITCLNDSNKLQLKFLNKEVLEEELKDKNISTEDLKAIKKYFDNSTLSENEIKTKINQLTPNFVNVVEGLKKYNHIYLTPLGILIGILNYKEQFKEDINWDF